MKLQHLAIMFVVIIMPISIVLSEYVGTQVETIKLQTRYTNIQTAATYDMMKSFQINTVNNRFSTISDSKIRDLEASINTFYRSMGTTMETAGMTQEMVQTYTPALLFTLYDGYYIYSKYNNVVEVDRDLPEDEYSQYGLKPYIYYSCRYKSGDSDFVVNYTLDNTITVYGMVKGKFQTMTGSLVNLDNNIFDGVTGEEVLTETIITMDPQNADEDKKELKKEYSYIIYENNKVYYDPDSNASNERKYFWYRDNKKNYISDEDTKAYAEGRRNGGYAPKSDSSIQYNNEAKQFTKWVIDNLGDITENDACNPDGSHLQLEVQLGGDGKIFNIGNGNDPLKADSNFNEHRLAVIRNSIKTNLAAAIYNFNDYSNVNYEFGLPEFTETDWDKILHDVCFVSFLQGLPIGAKYYNNYVVITNDKNKEFVSEDGIYLIDGQGHYHQPGCKALIEGTLQDSYGCSYEEIYNELQGYSNINFVMQNLTITEESSRHFYLQDNTYACYDCIVNSNYLYDLDDIKFKDSLTSPDGHSVNLNSFTAVKKAYLRALARERYNLYQTNRYFGIQENGDWKIK